ncbi:MAG: DUF2085 domain-containing protein [Candidatus Promineifilaceae bacterium]
MTTETTSSQETTEKKRKPVTGWQRSLVIGIDRVIYGVSKHWLAVFNILVAIYVGLPVLAPVLMHVGLTRPARVIYTVYSPMCHQMAQRSFFLFGDQPVYPREIAGTSYTPIESYIKDLPEFQGITTDNWGAFFPAARAFLGNEQMGYKTALCERDMGIYGAILAGGLLYAVLRRRYHVKPLPVMLFIILGMGPIGLDGFSQLFSYWFTPASGAAATGIMATLSHLLPLRESPPLLRTLTGIWFGLTLVWLAYPNVEEGMIDSEKNLGDKLRRAGAIQ